MLAHVPMAYLGDNVKVLTLSDQYLGLGIAKQISKYENRSVRIQMASPHDPHQIVQQFFSATRNGIYLFCHHSSDADTKNPNLTTIDYNFATQDPSLDLQQENNLLILDLKWNSKSLVFPTVYIRY